MPVAAALSTTTKFHMEVDRCFDQKMAFQQRGEKMMNALVPINRELPREQDQVKPVLSMELSLVSSSDANELAAVFSQDDDELTPTMTTACELVHTILDQVTWNDAPPTNDGLPSDSSADNERPGTKIFSRQCHVPPTTHQNTRVQSTSTGNDGCIGDPTKMWEECYNNYRNPSEIKMGSTALATLCSRTLDTVGKSSQPTKVLADIKDEPLSVRGSEPSIRKRRPQSKKTRSWLRRRKGSKEESQSPNYGEIIVSQHTLTKKREQKKFFELEERDDRSPASVLFDQENRSTPHRLQMFGSDYARYLSTTALAPRDLNPTRGQGIPRTTLNRRRGARSIQNIEDAELSVLTGPLTDLIVTAGEDQPPKGYYRISQSAGGDKFFLRDRKTPVYINVKKETNWDRAAQRPCVTALALVYPQRKEFVPPGFSVVRMHNLLPNAGERSPANINLGDEQIFLCFRRSREGNPITAILPLSPAKRESVPEGFTVLEKTPRNHVAVIQTQATQLFLAYRQRLANLEPLRPLPLVMSVHNSSGTTRKLEAYYCTGGTVVASRVGRFHIMDRSTHSLLSPSSISNRLLLIESSRRKALNTLNEIPTDKGSTYVYSAGGPNRMPTTTTETLTSSLLLTNGLGTPCSRSVVSDLERLSSAGDCESDMSLDVNGAFHQSDHDGHKATSPSMSRVSSTSEEENSDANRFKVVSSLYANEDTELGRCLEALSFIPVVSTAIEENEPKGMLRFQARVAVLTPILTACYTRHGGSALVAVEGLLDLLQGDFFSSDVDLDQDSSLRITLLDIAIQVVCDVATMGTQETQLQACVEFVESGVKYGCGHLNTRTVGYVLRFYLFVFYFGVTCPSGGNGAWGTVNGKDSFILEDPRSKAIPYLPGGAPQAAILALKDLITFSIARLQSLVASEYMMFHYGSPPNKRQFAPDIFNEMIESLVDEVVDKSVHRVEVANYTQLAMHQILRSGGSELFWYDMMNSCGAGLFGNDEALRAETRGMYSMLFAILTNCVKVASTQIRKDKNGEGMPRDVASKLMSLEMLHFFLLKWDENKQDMEVPKSRSYTTFMFTIRRLVVPCLLLNTADAMEDPRVYRRVIHIIGVLWNSSPYRRHMKLELGILLEHFIIKVLRLGPQILYKEKPKDEGDATYLFAQQIELIKALQGWFSDARGLLELFLNFDTDTESKTLTGVPSQELLSGVNWKITQKICAALCMICEKCGDFIAQQIRESQVMSTSVGKKEEDVEVLEGVSGTTLARESAQRLRTSALGAIGTLMKNLSESAAATKGPKFRALVDSWGIQTTGSLGDIVSTNTDSLSEDDDAGNDIGGRQGQDSGILGFWQKEITKKEEKAAEVKAQFVQEEESKIDHLGIAFDITREKGLRKGIDYLIACSVLTPSPRDIASFLRLHRSDLESVELGRYLGEAGSEASETEYWNLIRFSYIRAISFVGMTVEQGLRHLLTNGGFRLPGEAQQVDRLITTFAQCYWEDNAGDQINCPFQDQDTVFLLSFAIIMLNTDLHKSIPATKNKKPNRKRMTKAEFTNNLKGVANKADDLRPEYLSIIYDSIESHPIVLNDEMETSEAPSSSDRLKSDLQALSNNAKSLDALLRGLSTHEYKFVSLEEHSQDPLYDGNLKDATALLARKMMSQTWHLLYGLINAAVEIAHLDVQGMESCSIFLKYALAVTISLDMPMERSAFLGQLGRFRLFNAWRRGETEDDHSQVIEKCSDYKNEDWYTGIEEACVVDATKSAAAMDKNRLMALKLIDELITDLSMSQSGDNAQNRKATREAAKCLMNAEYLLHDPARQFLRTGNLWKRANRSGRLVEYRFFLFSDVLIYAKKANHTISGVSTQYKIHEELPLILMKVVDWFPPEQKREAKRGFQIYHPRKSFLVFASSREERGLWVSNIRSAIDKEISRKVAIEGARKAAAQPHK